jgi:hypothetical protein
MKNWYLLIAIIGFILPNIYVTMESVETGNVLLWLNPMATVEGMFANRISTAFIIDLLVVVVVFFAWSYGEAKRIGFKHVYWIWVLTMMFGMAGTFPLFLYFRAKAMEENTEA